MNTQTYQHQRVYCEHCNAKINPKVKRRVGSFCSDSCLAASIERDRIMIAQPLDLSVFPITYTKESQYRICRDSLSTAIKSMQSACTRPLEAW